jgi:hypothetical protein
MTGLNVRIGSPAVLWMRVAASDGTLHVTQLFGRRAPSRP